MRVGCFYRHPNCLDVDMYIIHIGYRDNKRIKAKVLYVKQTNHRFIYGGIDKVTIKNKSEWEQV